MNSRNDFALSPGDLATPLTDLLTAGIPSDPVTLGL